MAGLRCRLVLSTRCNCASWLPASPQATVRRGGEYTGGSRGEISFNGDLGGCYYVQLG